MNTHASRLNKLAQSVLIAILLVANSLSFVQANTEKQSLAWVDDYYKSAVSKAKKRNIPGFAFVVVTKDGDVVYKQYGKTEKNGSAITNKTKFRLASVSKTFTAALVAKQHQLELLDWQTKLSTLVPDYSIDNYDEKPILLRHIIGQSTGFMRNAYDNLIEANYKRPRVLKEFSKLDSICKPGYCYTYQNALFGALEEYYLAQDSSYSQELEKHIFAPLKMTATVGKDALESADSWAKPHAAIARNKWSKVKVKQDYYRFAPAAGVNASTSDMAIWLNAMLLNHPKVIDDTMRGQLTQPRVKTSGELRRRAWRKNLKSAHYGLGWRVYNFANKTLYYHGGWVQGYRADLAFSPELGIGMAFLMNAESNVINEISAEFWETAVSKKK